MAISVFQPLVKAGIASRHASLAASTHSFAMTAFVTTTMIESGFFLKLHSAGI